MSPLTNILILWAASFIFAGTIVACIAGFVFTPLGAAVAWIVAYGVYYVEFICSIIARFPFAVLYTINEYIRIWIASLYIIFGIYFADKNRRSPVIPIALCCMLLCLSAALGTAETDAGDLTVTAIDVRQGQCIVLSSGVYNVVVDCGGSSGSYAGENAAKYLFGRNVYRIDLLVLTHFDSDHVNGVTTLLGMQSVDTLVVPPECTGEDSSHRTEILDMAAALGIEIVELSANSTYYLGESTLNVYAPVGSESENEAGISALYSSGEFDALITGDMGSESEIKLIKSNDLPDIELLVAGHHGSKYSTSEVLLKALSPEISIISVGAGNIYGHPADETIQRLLEYNAQIYRTDIYGNVTVKVGQS